VSLYSDYILPHFINLSMRKGDLTPYRERVISRAEGRVLEIGIGSGHNLQLYGKSVEELLGLEPSPQLMSMAQRESVRCRRTLTLIAGSAEAIPMEDHYVDTVVTTWTLCSIPRARDALTEMRRVLRPGGQLLFVEHGLAPEAAVQRWQERLTPMWKRIGGGCHLNRPIRTLIESAGFSIADLNTGYMRGPRPLTYMYEGRATPAPI
jgi:ubiquinone/menaquinone biosynthesis C-methylase UbiE